MEENDVAIKAIIDNALKEANDLVDKNERKEKRDRAMALARMYDREDKVIPLAELAERVRNEPPRTAYLTGFENLDRITGGFREEQLVIIAAARKSGKTSLSLAMTRNMTAYKPLWFSYEQSFDELVGNWIEQGRELGMSDEQTIKSMPVCFVPNKLETDRAKVLHWIECRLVESIAKFNSKVVFIDHLHYLVNLSSNSLANEMRIITQNLKRMAKKWKVVFIVMAHVNKNAKLETAPTTDDIADASAVAQEADIVMMLWRKAQRENGNLVFFNELSVNVQANRRTGKTGVAEFDYKDGWYHEKEINGFTQTVYETA